MSSFDGDVWSCQLCDGIYVSLSKLVGHARGSHQYLNVKCGVNGCDELMSSAVSWYKHVRLHHRAEYYDSVVPETSAESRRHETTGDFDGDNDEMELSVITASDTETADMDSEADSTYNMLTASFLNLKDKHKLSQAAFDDVIKLAEHTCEHMKMKIMEDMKLLAEEQAFDVNSCFYKSLEDQIANMESPVHNVGSAYQQKKYFSANLPYIEPVWHPVGTHIATIHNSSTPSNISDGFYYIPLLDSLTKLLENKHVYQQVVSGPHQSCLHMMDICDGSIFKSKEIFRNCPTALQIVAYYDDVVVVNQLSPRAKEQKLGVIYYQLANLDPAYRSRLESINLVAIFNCSILKYHSFDSILKPFIDDIKALQEEGGHAFLLHEEEIKLQGALIAFVGDTPALAEVGGFKKSVGPAFRKCRECMATENQMQLYFSETKFHLRNHDTHLQHCQYIEGEGVSSSEREHFSKVYGINRCSLLTSVPDFDVTKQLPQDIMHVLFEGIFMYHTSWLLDNLSSVVTLSTINEGITSFSYAYFQPRPNCLSSTNVTGSQTATQMWELFHILPLLLFRSVPPSNQHYLCFMKLQQISMIICSPVISIHQIPFLRILIHEYLEEVAHLYSIILPPKFHYLVHVPSLIERYGPLIRLWCMRFEAKHQEFKKEARRTSFKNICLTLSKFQQRLQAYNIHCNEAFATFSTSNSSEKKVVISHLPYGLELQSALPSFQPMDSTTELYRCNNVTILGTKYVVNQCWMLIGVQRTDLATLPKFGELVDIILYGNEKVPLFVFTPAYTTSFDRMTAAFKIERESKYECRFRSSIKNHQLFNAVNIGGVLYIKSKIDLDVFCDYYD